MLFGVLFYKLLPPPRGDSDTCSVLLEETVTHALSSSSRRQWHMLCPRGDSGTCSVLLEETELENVESGGLAHRRRLKKKQFNDRDQPLLKFD